MEKDVPTPSSTSWQEEIGAHGASAPDKPDLSPDQQDKVLEAAIRRVVEAVLSNRLTGVEKLLGEVAELPVWGVFVTLRRGEQLRACLGHMGEKISLAAGLNAAAERAARWDLRFPPIQPGELGQLKIEVWLLWNCQRVSAKGESRLQAVEIGRHGLQVVRGRNRGLLLPGVATEHRLNARQFLEHVCRKAGLASDAWMQPETELYTFEGLMIEGPLAPHIPESLRPRTAGAVGMGDVLRLAAFAQQNLVVMLQGATPSFYTTSAYDGPVQGLVLTVKQPHAGKPEVQRLMEASRVFARGEVPLQATLMDLLQTVVAGFRGRNLDPQLAGQLQVGLTVFVNPHHIGTATDCALDEVDPRFDAICVSQEDRWAIRYSPRQTPTEILQAVMQRMKTPRPSQGQVYRLLALTTEEEIEASNVSRPVAGQAVRPPAVAGQFYPASANAVDDMLSQLLPQERPQEEWAGALVPHAGWRFSGKLAAEVWARLKIPSQVIIIGPKHHALGCDWAVAPHRVWALPGLSLHSDPDLAEGIVSAVPLFELDAAAHAMEHAIEVQLPIVARVASAARVVGVVMHKADYELLEQAAEQFARFLESLPARPLLVVSSDLHHYDSDETTRRLDNLVLDALAARDPRLLWQTVRENRISMCGVVPAVFVLKTLQRLGALNRCEIVGHTTSAETSGRTDRVVGYAGALFG